MFDSDFPIFLNAFCFGNLCFSVLFSGLATPQLRGFSSNDLIQTKCVQRPSSKCCTRRCGFWYHESCCWTLLCCIAAPVKNAKNQKWDASQLTLQSEGSFTNLNFPIHMLLGSFRSDSLHHVTGLFFLGGLATSIWRIHPSISPERSIARNL